MVHSRTVKAPNSSQFKENASHCRSLHDCTYSQATLLFHHDVNLRRTLKWFNAWDKLPSREIAVN